MRAEADPTLARLKRLPVRLRLVHLAALLRWERKGNARERSLSCPSPAERAGRVHGRPSGAVLKQ